MTGSARRSYTAALVLLAAGAGGLLLAYGLTWATVDVTLLPGADQSIRVQEVTGREIYPGAAASGWVALAAVAGIVATRRWARAAVGVVGLLAGLAGLAGAVAFVVDPSAAGEGAARTGAGWLLAAVAGAAVVVATSWTIARGAHWPVMGGRYERQRSAKREISAWDAQDLGRDPTDDLVE